jgi:hypothetical protein
MTTNAELAALHVLDGLAPTKTDRRIGWRDGTPTIDFAAIRDDCYSHGETVLCDVALDLWNGTGHATIADVVATLDDANFTRVVEAMAMIRGHTLAVEA